MRIFGGEQQLCPCYEECQEFQKLAELRDSGLVIYCHRTTGTEDITQDEAVRSPSKDVFILHNKKDVKITASELRSELEKKNISCPRCRKTLEHAQKLMKEVKLIEKEIVIGICDHCRKQAQTIKKQICTCDDIVKKFKFVKGEQTEDIKKCVKIWLSKMGHLLKDSKADHKQKQMKYRAHSDLQISRDHSLRQEPTIQQMFYPESHKSDINLKKQMTETDRKEDYLKPSVAFFETSIIPGTSLLDSEKSSMKTYTDVKKLPRSSLKEEKQGEQALVDTPSMDAKEELKRRHDLSLRQMMRFDKDPGVSISKIPHVYEIPKIAPWEQKEPTSKYNVESETDLKISSKTKYDFPSKRLVKYDDDKIRLSKSEEKNIKKLEQRSIDKVSQKTKKPDPQVAKLKTWYKKVSKPKDIRRPFSFFFPKVMKKEKSQVQMMSSTHLIKYTQEKKRQEKEYRQKLEHDLKKISREEKKVKAEEKKRQSVEDKKTQEKEQDRITKHQKYSKDDLRSPPEDDKEKEGKTIQDKSIQDTLEKEGDSKKGTKSKPDQEDKIIEELKKAKKDLKSKPEQKHKIDENLDKTKKDGKGKSDLKDKGDEAIKSRKKDLMEKPKQKSKDDLKSKATKYHKGEPNRKPALNEIEKKREKSVNEKKVIDIKQEKAIKIKKEEEAGDEKLQKKEMEERLKLIAQMRKEKESPKKETGKEQQSIDKEAPSKTLKSIKMKQDTPGDIKETVSEIQKKSKGNKEMTVDEKDTVEIKKEVAGKVHEEKKDKTNKDESDFKKIQAEHLKEKALQKKKQMERETQIAREKERNKNEGERNAKNELKIGDIRVEDFTESQLILRLVKLKQAASMKPSDVVPSVISEHRCHHGTNTRLFCPLCYNSELELEVISLDNKKNEPPESLKDIIIGEKIYKIKRFPEKSKQPGVSLNFYQHFSFDTPKEITPQEEHVQKLSKHLPKNNIDMEPGKGILRYALSDRTFIEKGWTVLPTEKVVRKMNVYRMRPAHPEFDWFEHNKNKRLMTYDSGERLAEFDDNGRGRWYYRSGRLALDYYDAEETNAQQRFVIYSSGEPDERGRTHPITILATFDYLGNGIVFDHAGKIRLKYNQTEGVVLDRSIGPVSHWKWHTLNDPPVLQQVMIDTQLPHKDPEILKLGPPVDKKTRPDNEEMLAIEFDNFIKEKSKKLSQKFKPFQIKMKALKINEHFSLRVLDQATVYLIFRDGSTNLKLNIGMILDHKEIVDTETAEVGEVANSLEQFPARTDSLAGLQRSVAHAQRYERQHAERERRLRRPEPCASADQLTAAASPPLRLPLRTVPSRTSSTTTGYCCKKPTSNLYYNTRLI